MLSRHKLSLWLSFIAAMLFTISCKKGSPEPSLEEKIEKVWIVASAFENNVRVYDRDGGITTRNYAAYSLDLSAAPDVTLTEVTGEKIRGRYRIEDNSRLVLYDLTPVPTGTDGTLTYTLTLTDTGLDLKQVGANLKTGNTQNNYHLVNP